MSETRTLPDHNRCDRHRYYKLSCDQYESLLSQCGHLCEICRQRPGYGAKLHIDHCGSLWAVRGLLCNGCNTRLQDDNCWCPAAEDYLANAWWQRQCLKFGYPASSKPPPEPPVGSAIRNQWGVIWVHFEQGRWHAPKQDGHGWPQDRWERVHYSYGPHNLVPFDLRQAIADRSLPHGVDYCLRNAIAWTEIRTVLGLPEPEPKRRVREWSPRDSLPWLSDPERTVRALQSFLTPEECRRIGELLTTEGG